MRRSENIREPSGDRTSREITSEHGTSGDVTRPLIDITGRGGHVDPASQPDGMQMMLAMAYREGYKLKAKLTGGVGVGDPKDYQPAKIAEHRLSEDDLKQLKFEEVKNQRATASSSNARHEVSSDSEEVYYHSDDDWTVIEEELTYRLPSKPKNPEKEVQPNDPVTYQNELLREGYRPRPPQGPLEHIVRFFSPGWKETHSKIEVINSEQNSKQYNDSLNKQIFEDLKSAKSIAKEFYRDQIEEAKNKLYDEIDKKENSKLKDIKSKVTKKIFKGQDENNMLEIKNQEYKLKGIKDQKNRMKERLKEIMKQKEKDIKEHRDKKNELEKNIAKHEDTLKKLEETDNSQEIKQSQKELEYLKEQKNEELKEITKYRKQLQEIKRLEDDLQRIEQYDKELQKIKEKRDEFAITVFIDRLSQNQEHAANRLAKEVEAILKRNDKSMQWLRLNLFRSNGIRF